MKKFELAYPGPLRDQLLQAIMDGKKTATSTPLSEWKSKEALPQSGERPTLVNSDEQEVGVVEITKVEQYKLGEVPWAVADAEGEDFTDVADWRRAHEQFWLAGNYNDSTANWQLSDDMMIVVEWFKLLKKS